MEKAANVKDIVQDPFKISQDSLAPWQQIIRMERVAQDFYRVLYKVKYYQFTTELVLIFQSNVNILLEI